MGKNKKLRSDGLVYSTDPGFKPEEIFEEQETLPASQQQLRVILDTKQRAGKMVTLVTGFRGKQDDLVSLEKRIKALCGTGGSSKNGEVIIQGDHRPKITDWLRKEGYKVK